MGRFFSDWQAHSEIIDLNVRSLRKKNKKVQCTFKVIERACEKVLTSDHLWRVETLIRRLMLRENDISETAVFCELLFPSFLVPICMIFIWGFFFLTARFKVPQLYKLTQADGLFYTAGKVVCLLSAA